MLFECVIRANLQLKEVTKQVEAILIPKCMKKFNWCLKEHVFRSISNNLTLNICCTLEKSERQKLLSSFKLLEDILKKEAKCYQTILET